MSAEPANPRPGIFWHLRQVRGERPCTLRGACAHRDGNEGGSANAWHAHDREPSRRCRDEHGHHGAPPAPEWRAGHPGLTGSSIHAWCSAPGNASHPSGRNAAKKRPAHRASPLQGGMRDIVPSCIRNRQDMDIIAGSRMGSNDVAPWFGSTSHGAMVTTVVTTVVGR